MVFDKRKHSISKCITNTNTPHSTLLTTHTHRNTRTHSVVSHEQYRRRVPFPHFNEFL